MAEEVHPRPRTCCVLTCDQPAEWEIWAGDRDNSDACEEHIGTLLGDAQEYHLYRLVPAEVKP